MNQKGPLWVQALDYLRAYDPEQCYYTAPFDLTQDGIASGLGITRAHATRVLNELEKRGLVEARLNHVIGGCRRRKVYFPTPAGMAAKRELSR